MGQERRAAHEEDRECRQADVRHRVVVATRRPLALVRQTGADPFQFRYQFINEAHPAVESRIESGHKGELLHRVGRREEIHNLWYFGLGPARCRPAPMPHAASFELTTSATHSYLEPLWPKPRSATTHTLMSAGSSSASRTSTRCS